VSLVSQHRRRVLETGLIVLLLAVYGWRFVLPVFTDPHPQASDFQDYLYAAHQIATGGDPYTSVVDTSQPGAWILSSRYLYPPAFALFLIPLTWLPTDLAIRLWLLLIQAMVLGTLVLVYRVIGAPSRREVLAITAVATTFFPLATSVWTGAMNAVLLLMLATGWALWTRSRDAVSGVVLGAAAVFKVFPALLLPYLAWRRNWRGAFFMGLTGVGGLALGLMVSGWAHNLYYFTQILPHLAAGTGYRENSSLAGLASRICDPSTADTARSAGWCGRAVGSPLELVLVALVALAIARARRPALEFGLVVAALPLLSTVSWSFQLVILIFPIALAVREVMSGRVSTLERQLLVVAWICFALAPLVHYSLILYSTPQSGIGAVLAGIAKWLFDDTYVAGDLLLFGVLWKLARAESSGAQSGASYSAAA
jgi:hypothetical protein